MKIQKGLDLPKFPRCCLDEKHYCERDAWREEFVARLKALEDAKSLDELFKLNDAIIVKGLNPNAGVYIQVKKVLEVFK